MIERNLAEDVKHSDPAATFESERIRLRENGLIWHCMALPPNACNGEERIVFTGHINCHDCALCILQGDIRWADDAFPVPWRARYTDCSDAEEWEGADAFDAYDDPVVGRQPIPGDIGELLRWAFYEPEPGNLRWTGRKVPEDKALKLDEWAFMTPGASAGRAVEMPLVAAVDSIFSLSMFQPKEG